MNNFKLIFNNHRLTTYLIPSEDKLEGRLILNNKEKPSFLEGIPIEFYLNYSNSFVKVSEDTTNNLGVAHFNFSCNYITGITECLGYAKVTINNTEYFSNTVRFNFEQIAAAPIITTLIVYSNDLILYNDDIILYEV